MDLAALLHGDQTLIAPLVAAGIATPEALTAMSPREVQHRRGIGPQKLAAIHAHLAAAGLSLQADPPPKARGDGIPRPGMRSLTDRWMAAYRHVNGVDYRWTGTGRDSDQAAARVLYDAVGWSETPTPTAIDDAGGAVRRYLGDCRRIGRVPTLPDMVRGLARWRQDTTAIAKGGGGSMMDKIREAMLAAQQVPDEELEVIGAE